MSEDVIVCRCSDLDLEYIRVLIGKGFTTLEELKRIARLGMGPCQGRTCIPLVMQELSKALNVPVSEISTTTSRPPAKSMKLGQIADAAEVLGGGAVFHD